MFLSPENAEIFPLALGVSCKSKVSNIIKAASAGLWNEVLGLNAINIESHEPYKFSSRLAPPMEKREDHNGGAREAGRQDFGNIP